MTAANARLKVATVCMNAVLDKEANLQTFFRYMEEAAAQRAKLIVFPKARAGESRDSAMAKARRARAERKCIIVEKRSQIHGSLL